MFRKGPAVLLLSVLVSFPVFSANDPGQKKVLILYELGTNQFTGGLGDARQLRQLMGHFRVQPDVQSVSGYQTGDLDRYDITFYIGFTRRDVPPQKFLQDVYNTSRPFVWINTGMGRFAGSFDLGKRYGFAYVRFDTATVYDAVEGNGRTFTKTEPNAAVIRITDPGRCAVLATAISSRRRVRIPYIVRSGSFWYVVDSPFSYATEADRYLLFADMLHDILGENHPVSHSALIRIEDTNPLSDAGQLRAVADILSSRHVPFLVGVVPFYVNPAAGMRVAMSEKPDYVDALHYIMERGGSIVMHGTTHQYRGETTTDYEFWDESRDNTLPVDSKDYVERKIREGILECMKNGVYPIAWETPHYTASTIDYQVFASHFTTAIEQRLVLDRTDESQYFPYVIFRDMYGQRIYPENLGYVPMESDLKKEEETVDRLIGFAKANLAVRDGFATAFFHPFVDLSVLERLVDGIENLGYTYIDLRDSTNTVTLDDRAIVSGSASISIRLNEQYLREIFFNENGEVARREVSPDRRSGVVQREIKLDPKWIYAAEPTEYQERNLSFWEKVRFEASKFFQRVFKSEPPHAPAIVLFLYDPRASGGALNDQSSLSGVFRVLNIPVDSAVVTPQATLRPGPYNIVLVPYNVTDTLTDDQVEVLRSYVEQGGNLITDFRNPVAAELGVKFLDAAVRVDRVRDRLFPEELLRWRRGEVMNKFETLRDDELFATDDRTQLPVVIGREYGDGKFIFFGTRFDPTSTGGYSRYPYLIQYVEKFLSLRSIVRRDQLEMYFDPGYRHNISIEQLATRWAAAGIRVINVAGWQEYAKYTYDYARLIRVAHANGILVYAWLELPQVSQKFWNDHPEWREKNYRGEDVRPSWRYPVALTDPGCLAAVVDYERRFLASYDWDGVNLAELYFESGRGVRDPRLMSPFHPSARNQFRHEFGFDPAELLDPASPRYWRNDQASLSLFVNFRVRTIARLHDTFLALVDSVRRAKPGFGVTVTIMDNLSAPELRSYLGVDVKELLALRSKYCFTLQVEDPESMWSLDPRRYETVGSRYAGIIGSRDFALDLNIYSLRSDSMITPFPTRTQTGTESYWLVNAAAQGARRATIYAESSVNPQDLVLLTSAYASQVRLGRIQDGWEVVTPVPIVLQLASGTMEILRNGERQLSIGDGKFLLPTGSYRVTLVPEGVRPFQVDILETRILSITGDLLSEKSSQRSVEFRYRSENRCIVTLTKEPFAVFVDGTETAFRALKGDGRFALMLPPGEHTILVVAQSSVSYGVDLTSFWSSSLIVVFGVLAGGILIVFYLIVRIRYRSIV